MVVCHRNRPTDAQATAAVADLHGAIAHRGPVRGFVSRDEVNHADFGETRFGLIERIGIARCTMLNADAAPEQGRTAPPRWRRSGRGRR